MTKKKHKRTEVIPTVRLTVGERKQLITEYRKSGYNYFTKFLRNKILAKGIFKNPKNSPSR